MPPQTLQDWPSLPGTAEALRGEARRHSIRINDQRRLCFVWRKPLTPMESKLLITMGRKECLTKPQAGSPRRSTARGIRGARWLKRESPAPQLRVPVTRMARSSTGGVPLRPTQRVAFGASFHSTPEFWLIFRTAPRFGDCPRPEEKKVEREVHRCPASVPRNLCRRSAGLGLMRSSAAVGYEGPPLEGEGKAASSCLPATAGKR